MGLIDAPIAPLILVGAISDKNIGPTQRPNPAPTPTSALDNTSQVDLGVTSKKVYLPTINGPIEAEIPIKPPPTATDSALARMAPLRPQRSMTRFATELPKSPPTVNTDVTSEKLASVIGIHVGIAEWNGLWPETLQVKTAWIWFRAEIW
jgi:hypothetical protein